MKKSMFRVFVLTCLILGFVVTSYGQKVVTIPQLQQVSLDSLNKLDILQADTTGFDLDKSPYWHLSNTAADTVRVTGVVIVKPRVLTYTLARYDLFIQDTTTGQLWSGLQVLTNDTSSQAQSTGITNLDTGMVVTITGRVCEFGTQNNSVTELLHYSATAPIYTTPPAISVGTTLPARPSPKEITLDSIAVGNTPKPSRGEKYESMYVIIRNVTVASVDGTTGRFTFQDALGNTGYMYDGSGWYTLRTHKFSNSTYAPPPVGAKLSFIRGVLVPLARTGTCGDYAIMPLYPGSSQLPSSTYVGDVVVAPPTISIFTPTSGPVGTSVTITGTNFNSVPSNNIVYFGAVRAGVSSATSTQLTVAVPPGATYQPLTVTDITTGLEVYSNQRFTLTFTGNRVIDTTSFLSAANLTTGIGPANVAIADFDGDGKPDIVVTDTTGSISVLRNTSIGNTVSFAPKVDFAAGSFPNCIEIGEFDGDGKPDIAVGNTGSNTVSVFRNTCTSGNISFASRLDLATGSIPIGIATRDLDGDGKSDIVVANVTGNSVSVFQNTSTTGSISFAPKVDLPTSYAPCVIAIVDLDGDTKPDMAVANAGTSSTVSVFRNTSTIGQISFAAEVDFATGGTPIQVAIADVDGDGRIDLITGDSPDKLRVFQNTSTVGNISFVSAVDLSMDTNTSLYGLVMGDINGDGKPDIVATNRNGITFMVFRNTGVGGIISFTPKVDFTTSGSKWGVSIGDLNGDGKPEIVVPNNSSNTLSVFRNSLTPQTPQSLIAFSGNTQVTLKWNKIAENRFLRYRVYMGTDSAAVSLKDSSTASITDTTKTITGLTNGTRYYFRVSALDSSRVESAQSYVVGVVPSNNLLSFQVNMRIAIKKGRFVLPTDSVIVRGYYNGWIANTDVLLDPNTDSTYTGAFNVGTAYPEYKFVIRHLGQDNWERQSTGNRSYTPTGNPQTLPVYYFDDDSIPPGLPPTITSLSPISGPIGTGVTITGSSFNPVLTKNIVCFGAVKATLTGGGTTALFVSVPMGATYAPVTVTDTSIGLSAYSAIPFNVIFPSSDVVSSNSFAGKVDFVSSSNPFGIAIGDLDGDGRLDLVVTDYSSNTISVFRNTSTLGAITASSFAPKVDFATGNSPYKVAIGDLDGDGKPEIVVTNSGGASISVFRNASTVGAITTSSFASKVDFGTAITPRDIVIRDLDGDGKPDIAVTNFGSNTVSILQNTSSKGSIASSSFASKVDFNSGSNPSCIATDDLDGDAKPDIVVGNYGSNTVSVLRNTSASGSITSGSFAAKVDFITANNVTSLAVGDLDGDGKPDIAAVNNGASSVSVLLNTSSPGAITVGSFAPKMDFATASNPFSIAIGDIDGDGKPDMAIAVAGSNSISIFRNTCTLGSVTSNSFAARIDFTTGNGPFAIAIGDLDGDGKPDVGVADNGAATFSVLRNTVAPQTPQNLTAMAGNGQVTLKWSRIAENRFLRYRIYRGTSSGGETLADSSTASILDTTKVMAGLTYGTTYYFRTTALDSSRIESSFSSEVSLTPQNPYATFTQPANNLGISDTIGFMGFAWGDYNNDGYLDLYRPGAGYPGKIYKNLGTSFTPVSMGADTAASYGAVWADFDGDGKLDLLTASGTSLKLFKGSGTDTLTNITSSANLASFTAPNNISIASVADLNKDGNLEVVFAGGVGTGGPINLLQSTSGVFSNIASTKLSSNGMFESWNPAWVDVNNDGNIDLWIPTIRTPGQPCALYINNGSTLALSNPTTTGITAASAIMSAWGDYDNDGSMDLFLIPFSGDSAGVAKLYHNNANGTFTDVAHSKGLDSAFADVRGVSWGDYDNDGKLDLLVSRMGNQQELFRNTGTSFVEVGGPAGINVSGSQSRSCTFVDYNNDGFLDIFLTSGWGPKFLFRNNGGNGNHWIGIKPVGAGNNKSAIGARVKIAYGSNRQIRDIQGGGTGGMTNGNLWANFGLGPTSTVDSVVILWPNGQTEKFKNPAIDKYSTITQGSSTLPPVIASFNPTSGPFGTSVTITGTNLNANPANDAVFFGAAKAAVTNTTAVSMTVAVPAGATYSPISMTDLTTGLTAYSSRSFILTFVGAGVITSSSFAPKADIASASVPRIIAAGDLDGDGMPDLAVAYWNSYSVSVFRNTSTVSNVSFAPRVDLALNGSRGFVRISDVDGDGKPDIIVTNVDTNGVNPGVVSVFRNTSTSGNITFAAKVDFALNRSGGDIGIADWDGDGKPDLAVPDWANNTIAIFRNTSTPGNISLATRVDLGTGTNPWDVATGDIDGDGKPDLAVTNQNSHTVSIYRNISTLGNISFVSKVDFVTDVNSGGPNAVAIGDLDGDGKADLAVTSWNDTLSVFRNTSTAGSITGSSFAPKINFLTGTGIGAAWVSISDLDGDGKPDLAVANNVGNTISVFQNKSTSGSITTSSFAPNVKYASGTSPNAITSADLDGDGKPDLAVTNNGANTISVLRNAAVAAPLSESEPNNIASQADQLSYGDSVNAAISPLSDVDYYKFSATAGDTVTISTHDINTSALNGELWLFSSNGYMASSNDDYLDVLSSKVSTRIDTTGTYYVRYAYYLNGSASSFPGSVRPGFETLLSVRVAGTGGSSTNPPKLLISSKSSSHNAKNVVATADTGSYGLRIGRFVKGLPVINSNNSIAFNVKKDSAQIGVDIYPNGLSTLISIQYGLSSSYGSTVSQGPYTGIGEVNTSAQLTGLTPNTLYHYRLGATNSAGPTVYGTDHTFTTSTVAPTNLTATSISSSQINLSWGAGAYGNPTLYRIFRSFLSTSGFVQVDSVAGSSTSYNNTGLIPSTIYYYSVYAVNSNGQSAASNQASATTASGAVAIPSAPTGLSATVISASQINLSWTASTTGSPSLYRIFRSPTSGSGFSEIDSVSATITTYSNSGLNASTTYYYLVYAVNAGGQSAASNQTNATTSAGVVAPSAPTGFIASVVSSSQVFLSWTASTTGGPSLYRIFRSLTSGSGFSRIDSVSGSTTTYNDSRLNVSTTYYYLVYAVNAGGQSVASNQASVTTLASGQTASIVVTTPAANWATTYNCLIQWSSQYVAGNVTIKLSTDNGSTFSTTIESGTTNSGSYSWSIPTTQVLSKNCVLRVESSTNPAIFGVSRVFAIVDGNTVSFGQPLTVAATYSSTPTSNAEYRLISFPGNTNGINVGQLSFSGAQDNDWKMFRDPGNTPGFVEMSSGSTLKTGEGYWYIQKGSLSKSVLFPTPALNSDATVSIALTGGTYSIIGNPFNVPVEWSSVLVLNGLDPLTPLYSWIGSWRSTDTLMLPGIGYYIHSTGLTALKIPYAAFGFPGQIPKEQLDAQWRLQLVYDSELNKDDDNYIGIATGTCIGKDRFEFNKPPLIFDESFVYMKRSEWDSHDDMFYGDYRPSIGEGQTWDFEITNPRKSLSTLSVLGVEGIPTTYNVYLVNEETGVTFSLRRQNSMQYGYGRTSGHFKVVVGPESYVSQQLQKYMPRDFGLEQNYPNPFNPSTTVRFMMPKESTVRLEVFTLLGQRIKVLAEGQFEAGVHEVVWKGDNDWGSRVASGVYFCRFVSGKSFVHTKKMLLTK